MYLKRIAIGVNIGGARIRAGPIDTNGQIIGIPEFIRTLAHEPSGMIIEQLTLLTRRIMQQTDGAELIGISTGSTGPLDISKDVTLECNNLPTLHSYPLHKKIESTFRLPVKLDNDTNAMMLGEVLWGAGRDLNSISEITFGTGSGVAMVVNGKIIRGATDCVGEIWLSPYKEGMIEDYISETGISNLYQRVTKRKISREEISKLVREGGVNTSKAWKGFTQTLTYTLSWTTNIVDPEAVITEGSVMHSSDIFWGSAVSLLKKYICPQTTAGIQLKPVDLKDNAGFMGAVALMFIE